MLAQWNPWFQWGMNLVAFAITFTLSSLVTVLFITRGQERRARLKSRADALFQLQMAALDQFLHAAVFYQNAALSAYVDIYQWKSKDKTAAMQQYEGAAWAGYEAALTRLEHRFKETGRVKPLIARLVHIHKQRHSIYDTLIDAQLDHGPLSDLWDRANEKRKQFEGLLTQAKNQSQEIISAIENEILASEPITD